VFGGSVPHFFYTALDHYITDDVALAPLKQLILERLIFMPLFQILALYMLARLEVSSV
jgi:peroxisomal membrane protein 2